MTVSVLHTERWSHLHVCGWLYQSYIQKQDLIYTSVDYCISPTYRKRISFTCLWMTVSVLHTETRSHLHVCGLLYQSYIQKQDLIYTSVDDCISHTRIEYMFWPSIFKPSTSQSLMQKTLHIRKVWSSSTKIFCMNDWPVDGPMVSAKQHKCCVKYKQPHKRNTVYPHITDVQVTEFCPFRNVG